MPVLVHCDLDATDTSCGFGGAGAPAAPFENPTTAASRIGQPTSQPQKRAADLGINPKFRASTGTDFWGGKKESASRTVLEVRTPGTDKGSDDNTSKCRRRG